MKNTHVDDRTASVQGSYIVRLGSPLDDDSLMNLAIAVLEAPSENGVEGIGAMSRDNVPVVRVLVRGIEAREERAEAWVRAVLDGHPGPTASVDSIQRERHQELGGHYIDTGEFRWADVQATDLVLTDAGPQTVLAAHHRSKGKSTFRCLDHRSGAVYDNWPFGSERVELLDRASGPAERFQILRENRVATVPALLGSIKAPPTPPGVRYDPRRGSVVTTPSRGAHG